jgi:hypothetical protein
VWISELVGPVCLVVFGLVVLGGCAYVVYWAACALGDVLIAIRARQRSRSSAENALNGIWECPCGKEFVTAGTATGITRAAEHTLRCEGIKVRHR